MENLQEPRGFRIEINGVNAKVFVGGVEIPSRLISRYVVTQSAGKPARLEVEVVGLAVSRIDGDAYVTIAEMCPGDNVKK